MAVGEWDQRQLCPNGGCVGVIGPDGTCKVCGRAAQNWGDERTRGLNALPDEEAETEEDVNEAALEDKEDEEDDEDEGEEEEDEEDEEDDEEDDEAEDVLDSPVAPGLAAASSPPAAWGSRQLCPDGSCIGLIGADGRCKVCGRAASSAPPDEPGPPGSTDTPSEPAAASAPASADATDTPSEPAAASAPASADATAPASETASTDQPGDGKLTV